MHAPLKESGGPDDARAKAEDCAPQTPQSSTQTELPAAGLTRPQIKVSQPAGDPLVLDQATLDFYLRAMAALDASGAP